jgi:hypothetical protein
LRRTRSASHQQSQAAVGADRVVDTEMGGVRKVKGGTGDVSRSHGVGVDDLDADPVLLDRLQYSWRNSLS